jgi:hypothetical protein
MSSGFSDWLIPMKSKGKLKQKQKKPAWLFNQTLSHGKYPF